MSSHRSPFALALSLALASAAFLPLALGCAVGPTAEDDTPNLASRRGLPSTSESTESPPSKPASSGEPTRDSGTPSVPPPANPTDGGAKDSSSSPPDASVLVQDASVSTPDATNPSTSAAQAGLGELAITEIQFDPIGAEPDGEWIEVMNRAATPRSLRGLELRDGGGRSHTIGADVVVAPGAYVVLARSRAAAVAQGVGSTDIVYEYGVGSTSGTGVILANGSTGAISIFAGTQELQRVAYGAFSLSATSGKTFELRTGSFATVGSSAMFCVAETTYGTGCFGTPGRPSMCP